MKQTKYILVALSLLSLFIINCGDKNPPKTTDTPKQPETRVETKTDAPKSSGAPNKGIGPFAKADIGAFDAKMAEEGLKLYKLKCSACHDIAERKVGPAIKGITTRRTPEWTMNMIINPTEMIQKDPIAKELLAEYLSQMNPQNVNEKETRAIYEYFRQVDGAK